MKKSTIILLYLLIVVSLLALLVPAFFGRYFPEESTLITIYPFFALGLLLGLNLVLVPYCKGFFRHYQDQEVIQITQAERKLLFVSVTALLIGFCSLMSLSFDLIF